MKFFQYSSSRRLLSALSAFALLAGFAGLAFALQSQFTSPNRLTRDFTAHDPGATSPQLFTVPGTPGATGKIPGLPGAPKPGAAVPPLTAPNGLLKPGQPLPGTVLAGDPKLAALFEQGVAAQRKGDLKGAAQAYRAVLRAKPDAVPAHLNLALVVLQQKQPRDAVWHLKRVIALSPRDPQPRALLAQTYLQLKDPGQAYRQWTEIANLKLPDNGQAAFNAGALAFERLKRLPEAERWLRRAVAEAKNQDPQSSLMLAKVLATRGKHAEAARVIEPAARQFPQVTEIQTTLADAQWQSGNKAKAIATLSALEKNTPLSQNNGQGLGQVRIMLGRAQAAQKQYSQAVDTLNGALAVLPKDSPAIQPAKGLLAQTLAARAETEEKQGQLKKAVASWGEASTVFPDNPFPYIQRGRLLDKDNDDREALTEYNQALKIVPRDANALLGAAQLEEKTGDAARAMTHWKTLVETRPEYTAAYFHLARIAAQQKQFAEQMDYFETRLAKNPNQRAPYDAILEAGHNAGRTELARDWVEIMVKKYPKASAPRNALIAYERRHPTPKPAKTPAPTATPTNTPTPKPTVTPTNTPTPKPATTPATPQPEEETPTEHTPPSQASTPAKPDDNQS